MSFLTFLRDDIRAGLNSAAPEYRDKHTRWLRGQQQPDGGFANRRGKSDLYYTAFALRGLSALNALNKDVAAPAAGYLAGLLAQPLTNRRRQPAGCFCDAVMAASWWDSLRLCEDVVGPQLAVDASAVAIRETSERLEQLRRRDGGWAKTDVDACGSLYHTFLASCAYMLMGQDPPRQESIGPFLKSLIVPTGGFLENRYSKKPGTNGCAAGVALSVALLLELDVSPLEKFLAEMHSAEGGFHATPAAPIADLLSTYTGLLTLKLLNQSHTRFIVAASRYARGLEQAGGGYTGFALETIVDCEYTFYGLGVESLTASFLKSAAAQ